MGRLGQLTLLVLCSSLLAIYCIGNRAVAGQTEAELRLLTEPWEPVSYEVEGVAKGFAVELVNHLQASIGTKHPIEVLPWARGFAIATSTPNVLLFATSVDEQRRKQFDFVGPILTSNISLYTRAEDTIEIDSMEQVKRAGIIGAYRGSLGEGVLRRSGVEQLLIASFPHQNAKQLMRGRVRFWCQADIAVNSLLAKVGGDPERVRPVFVISKLELYLAFSKGTDESVVTRWSEALIRFKDSGQYSKLYHRWFKEVREPGETEILWRER
ncbi:ABC transporter substrate-binding protein [uncultured Shewanella sp.]|uniref:substrate-binding periplasmic protein n=1 Tax=Shewanella atlantica TaxID=271099 RepID=UPI0026307D92|nr:ABC transporter substrate-binding protein [uncultured Shewanella sp.]